MSFYHKDPDGDEIKVREGTGGEGCNIYMKTPICGAYLPKDKVDELVIQLYTIIDVETAEYNPWSMPTPATVEEAQALAKHYALTARRLALETTKQEARDQLVKDFFKRTKDVTLDQVTLENRVEYETTCLFFDTLPYDAPGAR